MQDTLLVPLKLAKEIGTEQAIILSQLSDLIKENKGEIKPLPKPYQGEAPWVRMSYREASDVLQVSYRSVQRYFRNLEKKGYVISGDFNLNREDRTKWYTINPDYKIK